MGSLQDLTSARQITIGLEFLVGRSAGCALVIDDPCVSGQHALLRWRKDRWSVRDLGSRNGTLVDGDKLRPGDDIELNRGAVLSFGGQAQRWQLVADGPPITAACHTDSGAVSYAERGLLCLPDPDQPEVTLHCDEEGNWTLEQADDVRAVSDQQELMLSDGRWQIWVPQHGNAVDSTRTASDTPCVLRLLTMHFRVSRDEEYVELDLHHGEQITALGARSHHHMLLMLARARSQDRGNASLGHAEQGWIYVDDLCGMLDCSQDQLNILVFRARKQLSQAGVDNGGQVVERRPSTQQLRLGTDQFSIDTL